MFLNPYTHDDPHNRYPIHGSSDLQAKKLRSAKLSLDLEALKPSE